MARVPFLEENIVKTTNYDYPKLKLAKGEQARILLLEDPEMEFVHTLNKPVLLNGAPKMVTKQRRNGEEYLDYATAFVTRAICLGDATTLADGGGSDPRNCPMCKLAKDFPDYTKPPQRRFAMHVIRYRNKPKSFDPSTPFSVEVLVWSFTDQIYTRITGFKTEWKDLRKHDLLLGPCTEPEYQKFDISVAASAAWLETKERKALTWETFQENQIPDLAIAVGTLKQRSWIEQDIETIKEAWAEVKGASVADDTDLDTELSTLLEQTKPAARKSAPKTSEVIDLETGEVLEDGDLSNDVWDMTDSGDDLTDLSDLDDIVPEPVTKAPAKKAPAKKAAPVVEEPVEEASAEEESAEEASGDDGLDNFDDLLAGL